MMMEFHDHFSRASSQYASSRPTYPRELFKYLSTLCQSHQRAWDCGTGNGQAAIGLAEFFTQVDASDPSSEQLRNAVAHSRVQYVLCKAENTEFPSDNFDLVAVAQALHWFELDKFYAEAHRVLKSAGVFAAWGYSWFNISEQIDAVIEQKLLAPIRPYWAPENKLLWDGYQSIPFPFIEISTPQFKIDLTWRLQEVLDYVGTWSALRAYEADTGEQILDRVSQSLAPLWGDLDRRRDIQMNVHLRVGSKS